jgi:hypothetical protein
MELNRPAFDIDFNLSKELPFTAIDVLQPFAVGPAIADPSAFVLHAMHRIGAARSFIAHLTFS